jgi:hypothetical protein
MKKRLNIYIFLAGLLFSLPETNAQKPFEINVRLDALNVPININTFREKGLGYYDIKGRGDLTHAVYVDFIHWLGGPLGMSLGAGLRNFSSKIHIGIPDPTDKNGPIYSERDYTFSAHGIGFTMALLYKKKRMKAGLGYTYFVYSNQKYPVRSSGGGTSSFLKNGVVVAKMKIEERSYTSEIPSSISLFQLRGQYQLKRNLFLHLGLETSISFDALKPYTLKITGYAASTAKNIDQRLNNFAMKNTLAGFSIGITYGIGFGSMDNRPLD